MSQQFKYIITVILVALGAVFLFQLFWLKGLYHSLEGQMRLEVVKSIEKANIEELDSRISKIEEEGEHKGLTINVSSTIENNGSPKEYKPTKKTYINQSDTIQEDLDDDFSFKDVNFFFNSFMETMHQTVDSVEFVSLDSLKYFVNKSFNEKGIDAAIYKIEVVNISKDSILHTKEFVDGSKGDIFDYTYDTANQIVYRLHTESLTKNILTQMTGILVSTLLILLLLIIAFWYLLKTIFNQKTLDEMKDDFTNNMTHELKTPIAVAYAANDALLNFGQAENKEKREKYLQINKVQLEKLSTLVEQILSMSMELRTKMQLNKQELSLKEILDYQIEHHKLKAGKKIDFDLDINPRDMFVFADKEHFNNVVSNLIDNAIKYSRQELKISIRAYQDENNTIVELSDNGIGIAKDKQKYIFDKFYRIPQGNRHDAKGYGIGLFYVRSIIEKHGGIIDVESKLERGTTFFIKLPLK